MNEQAGLEASAITTPKSPARKRHWWRWILASAAALVVLVVLVAGIIIKFQPAPAPLTLPRGAASAPVGPLDGTWHVAAGSVAGFRVQETALGMSNDAVGRTHAVAGTVVVSGGRVATAALRIDLAAVKVNGKTQPQFATSLDTRDHPIATFTLTRPTTLNAAFASGAAITATATGNLTMHGVTHPVTVTISARRDGSALQAAGAIPVVFPAWGIKGPKGYGFFASLANHGEAEFLLVLHRQ